MSTARAASPIVMLHGWAMRPTVWTEVAHALAATLGAAQVLHAPALPGHDGAAPAAPTLSAWADRLAAGVPDGAVLAGWSLGAMLAMEIARRHAHKVRHLVLIGASARFVAAADWPHALAGDTVARFVDDFARAPHATLQRFAALQVLGEPGARTLARRLMQHSALPAAGAAPAQASALQAGLALLCSADLRATASALPQPCTIVHGEADAIMPVDGARWLQERLARAQLHRLPGAGHALPLCASAECARLIAAAATASAARDA